MNELKINKLSKDIEIPEIVIKKANDTFKKITSMANDEKNNDKRRKTTWTKQYRIAATLVLCVVSLGAITAVTAGVLSLNPGLAKYFGLSEGDKAVIDEEAISWIGLSDTVNGVTISIDQTVIDNHYVYIAYGINGISMSEEDNIGFRNIDITIDGNKYAMLGESDGYTDTEEGEVYSFHHILCIDVRDNEESFVGKTIHIELSDLGVYDENESVGVLVEGTWCFDWTLQGSKDIRIVEVDEELYGSGFVVSRVELSPISAYVTIDIPEKPNQYSDSSLTYPMITGVKMKDGSAYLAAFDTGGTYCKDGVYILQFSSRRILDVENVESLLFINPTAYHQGEEITIDETFEVRLP